MEENKGIVFIVEPDKSARLARLSESEIAAQIGGIEKKVTLNQTSDLGSVIKLYLSDQSQPHPLCRILSIDGKDYPIFGTFAVARENKYGELDCIKDVPLPLYHMLITPLSVATKGVAVC